METQAASATTTETMGVPEWKLATMKLQAKINSLESTLDDKFKNFQAKMMADAKLMLERALGKSINLTVEQSQELFGSVSIEDIESMMVNRPNEITMEEKTIEESKTVSLVTLMVDDISEDKVFDESSVITNEEFITVENSIECDDLAKGLQERSSIKCVRLDSSMRVTEVSSKTIEYSRCLTSMADQHTNDGLSMGSSFGESSDSVVVLWIKTLHSLIYTLHIVERQLAQSQFSASSKKVEGNITNRGNDAITLWVNKVDLYNNPQEKYNYYSLPFCQPSLNFAHKWGGFGDVLGGNELIDSKINIKLQKVVDKSVICQLKLDEAKAKQFNDAIENNYWFEFFVDDLPFWGFVGELQYEDEDEQLKEIERVYSIRIINNDMFVEVDDPYRFRLLLMESNNIYFERDNFSVQEKFDTDGVVDHGRRKKKCIFALHLDPWHAIIFELGCRCLFRKHKIMMRQKLICEFENTSVLITDQKISSIKDIISLLEKTTQLRSFLLIIIEDVIGETVVTLMTNKLQGILNVVVIKATDFSERRKTILRYIFIMTDAEYQAIDLGLLAENISVEKFDITRKVTITKDLTQFIVGVASMDGIQARVKDINPKFWRHFTFESRAVLNPMAGILGGIVGQEIVKACSVFGLKLQKKLDAKVFMMRFGSLGAKCNTRMVLLHKTKNYGASQDLLEKQAQMYIVHSLPRHCLTWALSKFEGLLEKVFVEVNRYLFNSIEYKDTLWVHIGLSAIADMKKLLPIHILIPIKSKRTCGHI